jgi:concanavalin A-like lectin/glucanase superfamily protein
MAVAVRMVHFPIRLLAFLLGLLAFLLLLPAAAGAQPFGAWPVFQKTTGKYIEVPTSPDLNPTAAITIEAWLGASDPGSCSSIVGKGFTTTYWVGICGTTLRSYLAGSGSLKDGGTVPASQFTHVAVTYDGSFRHHYINGEDVATFPQAGVLPTNAQPLRIGSDVNWDFQPQGLIDEVRIWNVARTIDQIRSTINVPITSPQPGLVARWGLDANATDSVGGHNGAIVGGLGFLTFPAILNCGAGSATAACLNTHFLASIRFRDPNTGVESDAQVVSCPNPDSAMFWFFASNAWEVMVKTVNACGFDDRYWVFSAATTNVFYRLNVSDVRAGANKIYFNYPGPPASAVTDTSAFATCP